jgi:tetratricopeptide (TPR) repeat protein
MDRWSDALAKFERALEIGGEQASYLTSRALARAYLRSLDKALADVERAIAVEGMDASRLNLGGWICNLKGTWSDAEPALSEAIALEPSHDFAHANRAYARWRMGNRVGARADLDRLAALALEDGKRAEPRRSRMLTYAWRVVGDGWARAVANEPDEPVARYGRAVCHWLAGDIEDARAEWAAAVAKGLAASGSRNVVDQSLRVS